MAKVSIATFEEAAGPTRSAFDATPHPIGVSVHRLPEGGALEIGPGATDTALYVWSGAIRVNGTPLAPDSNMIVERGASARVESTHRDTALVAFAANGATGAPLAGGHVHLLPAERVPRSAALAGSTGVGGALHANSACPTCSVWLHENSLPAPTPGSPVDMDAGIHSHTEDEVIFVIAGQIRLGQRFYGPGTAVAIAADTFYAFSPGPAGLRFINFRATAPKDILFKSGAAINEIEYWRSRLPSPEYL